MRLQAYLVELLWLLIAGLVACAAVAPAYVNAGDYSFLTANLLIVAGAITFARLLFFYRQVPWLTPIAVKATLSILTIPVFLFTVLTINEVQNLIDAEGLASMFGSEATAEAEQWGRYVRNELVFFGTMLLISAVILPFVLMVGTWRQVKTRSSARRSQVAR